MEYNFMEKLKGGLAEPKFRNLIKNPLLLPQITENIFKYCNPMDLLKYRKVCKLWNKEAVRILNTIPESCKEVDLNSFNSKELNNFHTLIAKSNDPEILFNNINLFLRDSDDFTKLNYNTIGFKTPQHEDIFKTFGIFVKRLAIVSYHDYDWNIILNKCLGSNSYCPGVEILDLKWTQWDIIPQRQPLVEFGPLKLKQMVLRNLRTIQISEFFENVFENSTGIISLHLFNLTYPSCSDTGRTLEVLQRSPHITKTLKELVINGNILDNWKKLCEIQFGKSFKTVTLRHLEMKARSFFETTKDEREKGLNDFLNCVSESVESFELNLFDNVNKGLIFEVHDLQELPLMSKLENLSFTGNCWRSLNNFDFLENLPSLRKLTLQKKQGFENFVRNILKRESASMDLFSRHFVHENLEQVYFHYPLSYIPEISRCFEIQNLNALFPRYSEIVVNLSRPNFNEPWESGELFQFHSLFEAISEMTNLKSLTLQFKSKFGKVGPEVIQAFSHLKKIKKLEKLIISAFKNVDIKFLREPLLEIINAPQLCVIELHNLKKNNENVQRYINEIKRLAARSISIITVPAPEGHSTDARGCCSH